MICWQQVLELRDDVGPENFPEVVEIFLEEVEENLAALGPDARQEELFHTLKGSALNLGFESFARLCAQGERNAAAGVPTDLEQLRRTYAESRAIFLAELEARLAA